MPLAPLGLLVAALVRCTSKGPILFRQARAGLNGEVFELMKFRTMTVASGPRITSCDDRRITCSGRFLRRSRLDELPQLWNVLRGEMSLVGPRPELPEIVAEYRDRDRLVLSVRPGLTDPASLAFRDEAVWLEGRADPERWYRERVLPLKLGLSRRYVRRATLRSDLRLLIETVCLVARGVPAKQPRRLRP
ncbi:MAG: sugar transferase [Planctomycetota bacterium]